MTDIGLISEDKEEQRTIGNQSLSEQANPSEQ